jgi:RNA polymerase sigma-70 factor (ECF subfamily)
MKAQGPLEPSSDQQLVSLANQGKADAMEELYQRYRDRVVRQAFRYTRSRDDALDVLQETFAYLITKFPGFELRSKMTTFLFPVVRSLSLTLINKRSRTASLENGVPEPSESPEEEPSAGTDDLADAVASLPLEQREVIHLRFSEDMPLAEISEVLEVPLGTVKSRLHNALQKLRGKLAK